MAILTISREIGSGGREIAYAVSERLGYRLITRETLFADINRDGGKWEKWGKVLDEHAPSIWEKYDWSFRGFGALLQSHIIEHALSDNVVIMGRGGNILLSGVPHVLRVRVVAPLGMRIDRLARRESMDADSARWLAEKTDSERAGFIHALYGRRWDDPGEYDMVVDMGKQTEEAAIAGVMAALAKRDALKTDKAIAELSLRALAARIKARILTDSAFFIPLFDVTAEEGRLTIRGIVHSPKEHGRIEEAARKMAADVPLRCELRYRM